MFWRTMGVYRAEKLWACSEDLPTESIRVELLKPVLDAWLWYEGTPNEVFLHKSRPDYENHHERIMTCDTSFPIIICDVFSDDEISGSIQGQYDVLDGLHRLCKLVYLENASHISVKKISHDLLATIREPEE